MPVAEAGLVVSVVARGRVVPVWWMGRPGWPVMVVTVVPVVPEVSVVWVRRAVSVAVPAVWVLRAVRAVLAVPVVRLVVWEGTRVLVESVGVAGPVVAAASAAAAPITVL